MRLEITRKTDLALAALQALAASHEPLKGKDLASTINTTVPFIAQVMKPLVDHGWVDSDRGPLGGYRLAVEAKAVSVLELIELIEGPTEDGKCVLQGTPCPVVDHCALHDAWTRARAALLAELAATPIVETANQEIAQP